MTPKQIFQKTEADLSQWWSAVAHHDNFGKVLVFARAELLESSITTDQLKGAQLLADCLKSIATTDTRPLGLPKSGLNHAISDPETEKEQQPTP